jgi:hypothetical protein
MTYLHDVPLSKPHSTHRWLPLFSAKTGGCIIILTLLFQLLLSSFKEIERIEQDKDALHREAEVLRYLALNQSHYFASFACSYRAVAFACPCFTFLP